MLRLIRARLFVHLVLIVVVTIALVPFSHSTRNRTQDENDFRTRMRELSKWDCKIPRPKLVYIGDENKEQLTPNSLWIPLVAVMHRCEHSSGCCSNHPTQKCKPKTSEDASVVFQKIDVITYEQTFERLTFTNHTSCECRAS